MSRTNQLDLALAALNDGALPSSEEDFINLFCKAYLDHEANGLKDPKIKGREADDDDGTRVRVRTKFRGTKLELPSRYIRDQAPPTFEQTLRNIAKDAWEQVPWLRAVCQGHEPRSLSLRARSTVSRSHVRVTVKFPVSVHRAA